jgi:hypothetical protein
LFIKESRWSEPFVDGLNHLSMVWTICRWSEPFVGFSICILVSSVVTLKNYPFGITQWVCKKIISVTLYDTLFEWMIIHYPIQYIKNCWVRLLSNYNIKYICTIYTRLYTCLTSIHRFALREKVTLRSLKLLLEWVDVVEWSRALDVRLSEWCCSVSMVWVQIPSREEQKFDSSKNLILTLFGLIFRRIFNI